MTERDAIYHFQLGETDARARWIGDEFVILQGSKITPQARRSCPDYIRRERDEYRSSGIIDATGRVLEDIPLSSVSRAASFAHGTSVAVKNTPQAWINERGEQAPRRGVTAR